ncbi:MAG: hypothetical protein ACJ79X_05985 [Gemmatimonadaceae bacterium]
MMKQFLDVLGIPNDDGRIDSESTEVPEQKEEDVARAADAIVKDFSIDDVVTYFLTLLLQDATTWGAVRSWLVARAA